MLPQEVCSALEKSFSILLSNIFSNYIENVMDLFDAETSERMSAETPD